VTIPEYGRHTATIATTTPTCARSTAALFIGEEQWLQQVVLVPHTRDRLRDEKETFASFISVVWQR
jgi:hypothetical protein